MDAAQHTVFITGAARGLGLALVDRYLEAGWNTIATYRNSELPASLGTLLERYPARCRAVQLDLLDPQAIAALGTVLQGVAIDVLINNAGTPGAAYEEQGFDSARGIDSWQEAFLVNAIAPHRIVQALVANLEAGTGKKILNISSIVASLGEPPVAGLYEYRSSKAALNAISAGQAMDLRERGITVVAVHPGLVRTAMGGDYATRLPEEAALDIFNLGNVLGLEDTGRFLDYGGNRLPW